MKLICPLALLRNTCLEQECNLSGSMVQDAPGGSGLFEKWVQLESVEQSESDGRFERRVVIKQRTPPAELKTRSLAEQWFYSLADDGSIMAVGDDPSVLAGLGPAQLDSIAVYEDLSYGFHFGSRTLFQGVRRLRRNERVVFGKGTARLETADLQPDNGTSRDEYVRRLSVMTARSFSQGYALELSGGRDSRLLLAMGAAEGEMPNLAITFGEETSADVRIARRITTSLNIEHHVLPIAVNPETAVADAIEFVPLTGYISNACAYAWMPALFRRLAQYREGQVTGQGGEILGGFYYSGLDRFVEVTGLLDPWIRLRLEIPGNLASRIFRSSVAKYCRAASRAEVRGVLRQKQGSWRERLDQSYRTERMEMWCYPGLVAYCHWYKILAPFLEPDYLLFADMTPVHERVDRIAQEALIARLCPRLLDIPFDNEIGGRALARSHVTRILGKARASVERICSLPRSPAPGWGESAEVLCRDRTITEGIHDLTASSELGLNEATITQLLQSPYEHAQAVGALVTTSLAAKALRRNRNALAVRATL